MKDDYTEDEIFNIDEYSLFYKQMPESTLKFKSETYVGGKLSKHRVTVLVGANMTGIEKRKFSCNWKVEKA